MRHLLHREMWVVSWFVYAVWVLELSEAGSISAGLILAVNNLPSGVLAFTLIPRTQNQSFLIFFPSLQIHVVFTY